MIHNNANKDCVVKELIDAPKEAYLGMSHKLIVKLQMSAVNADRFKNLKSPLAVNKVLKMKVRLIGMKQVRILVKTLFP